VLYLHHLTPLHAAAAFTALPNGFDPERWSTSRAAGARRAAGERPQPPLRRASRRGAYGGADATFWVDVPPSRPDRRRRPVPARDRVPATGLAPGQRRRVTFDDRGRVIAERVERLG
jgi:hypothetical protein